MSRSLVVFLAMILMDGSPVWGDDGAVTGVGGRIKLMDEHPAIVLVAEHVRANVSLVDRTAHVECIFVLSNHGEADSVLVGFPETASGDASSRPFSMFRSFVDGREVTCRREEGEKRLDPLFWWTRKIYFAAGQTRLIRDEYEAPLGFSVGDSTGNDAFFEYTLWTGSSRAGPIGAASIVVAVSPCDSARVARFVTPEPVESDPCEYRWYLSESEPGRDAPGIIQVAWLIPFPERRQHNR